MRKLSFTLFSLILILTACQPTPAKEVIFNRENIYSLAKKNTVEFQNYLYDDKMVEVVTSPSEKLKINIDAKVEISNKNIFPVYSVKPIAFNRALIEKLINYFMPDAKFYTNPYQLTKKQLLEELTVIKQTELYSENESQEVKDEAEADRQKTIKDIQNEIAEAPEKIERTYVGINDIIDSKTMNIDADKNAIGVEYRGSGDAVISVTNMNTDSYTSCFKFDTGGLIQTDNFLQQTHQTVGEVSIEQSKAEAAAKKVINDLNIDGITQVSIQKAIKYDRFNYKVIAKGYYILYRREIKGLKTVDIGTSVVYNPDAPAIYIPPWRQEEIIMFIDNTGIQSFYWIGLSNINETVSENVALLPYKDIQQRIRKQLIYNNIWVADTKDFEMNINVNKIILGIALIGTKDNIDTGMLVPAWYILYNESVPEMDYEKKNALVLNAIDGSIIEPRLDTYMITSPEK